MTFIPNRSSKGILFLESKLNVASTVFTFVMFKEKLQDSQSNKSCNLCRFMFKRAVWISHKGLPHLGHLQECNSCSTICNFFLCINFPQGYRTVYLSGGIASDSLLIVFFS